MTNRRRTVALLLLVAGVIGGLWYTGRTGWRTTELFEREVARFRQAGADGYIKDTRRYASYRYVVAQGEPAVAVLLPRLREGDPAERFVAAALLGTIVRQALARTSGTEQGAPISKSTLEAIIRALREAHAAASGESYLRGMIARDLQHVR